tara:strand:+ start:825 stop:2315 length:1491 start_codon:yes stop_codon:yes gene_type:complete
MSKHILSVKQIKKQLLSLSDSIESFFNKLKFFIKDIKKSKYSPYNRVFLGSGIIVILTLFYFLIPTFYNKDTLQSEIKSQILKKYNIELKFNEKIKYRLLPKPHYLAENLSLVNGKDEIAIAENFKIYIVVSKFFSINKIEIKDLVFKKTDFTLDFKNFSFFLKLLETEPNENKILIKNSNIFFKNSDDDILFINKIKDSKFFYDPNNLMNVLHSKNEVFNVPFKLIVKKDKFNKKILTEFNSKKIRLNIENELYYDKKIKQGLTEILFVNKDTSFNYRIDKNSLNFDSENKKNSYEGIIDFKPFYFSAKLNYDGLSSRNLFNENSFFIDLIRSKIFNNQNINSNIDLNVKNITNIDELNNLFLKISISGGNIGFSNSSVMWRENLEILLKESLLTTDNDEINLSGKVILNFKKIDNFYRSFQIQKIHRKDIKEIQIDFVYNLYTKEITFDNVKIDNSQNSDLEKYVDEFNSKEDRIFNKITFKNFVNNFFAVYAG